MSSRVVLFSNPLAGRGKAAAVSDALCGQLTDRHAIELFALPMPAGDLDRLRSLPAIDAAIVVGGDGTLQGVAEMLVDTRRPPPPILVVPLGTANLVAQHLALPWRHSLDVKSIAQALAARRTVELDICRCNRRLFLAMAGVGFDAHVVHELHRRRRGPITKASYVLPTLAALRDYGFPCVRVAVDGREIFPEAPGLVYIANIKEYGTGVPMLPAARSDDRLLDVCVLPCRDPLQAVRWMMHAATEMHIGGEGAVFARGRRVRIDSPRSVAIQLDGEAAGHTPADIELIDQRLEFIVAG